MWTKMSVICGLLVVFFVVGCNLPVTEDSGAGFVAEHGGAGEFKIPLEKGYAWEVTQSWADHCEECNKRAYGWDYCSSDMSHTWSCCEYAWDFNLPGNTDNGKAVLASGDGEVYAIGNDDGWGEYIVIDHGNVCSRSAHMVEESSSHLSVGDRVCQGLKIGEIGTSGLSTGYHLHFHFEDCESGDPVEMGFSDGNGVPKCRMGDDVFGADGKYNFLKLTNTMVDSCDNESTDEVEPQNGWNEVSCGSIPGCPLNNDCDRIGAPHFSDDHKLTSTTRVAASYLWRECALDGSNDGSLHPTDTITTAEALKIPLELFGLMDECGDPNDEEDYEEWYYPFIACAVKLGVVNSDALMSAESPAKFGISAQMLVDLAKKAGVISMHASGSHFNHIGEGNSAYSYVETIYFYGGIVPSLLHYRASDKIDRREYIVMASSLSPCFCGNISCSWGCKCEQDNFSCIDTYDSGPGIGGEEEDSPAEDPPEEEENDSGFFDELPHLSIDCYVDTEDTRCESDGTILDIGCNIRNNGDRELRLNNLVMKMSNDVPGCSVTNSELKSGVGIQSIAPGEEKKLNGDFEITCTQSYTGNVSATFDLIERIDGENNLHRNALSDVFLVPAAAFGVCEEEEEEEEEDEDPFIFPDPWENCTPNGVALDPPSPEGVIDPWELPIDGGCVYPLELIVPDGHMELITSASSEVYTYSFGSNACHLLEIPCHALPAAFMVRPSPNYGESAAVLRWDQPAFELWGGNYQGELTLTPPEDYQFYNPAVVGHASSAHGLPILIRVQPIN